MVLATFCSLMVICKQEAYLYGKFLPQTSGRGERNGITIGLAPPCLWSFRQDLNLQPLDTEGMSRYLVVCISGYQPQCKDKRGMFMELQVCSGFCCCACQTSVYFRSYSLTCHTFVCFGFTVVLPDVCVAAVLNAMFLCVSGSYCLTCHTLPRQPGHCLFDVLSKSRRVLDSTDDTGNWNRSLYTGQPLDEQTKIFTVQNQ